jgi:cytochrome c peroxidase
MQTHTAARQAWAFGLPLVLALALAGCGGGGSTATSTAATGTATVTTSVTSPPLVTTIATPAAVSAVLAVDFNAVPNYSTPTLPAYFDATVTALDNTPASNTANDKIALLGRVLFNDRKLSINEALSCASCHQQALGFDDDERFSTGFAGTAFTGAHAMRLLNVRYFRPGSMFWNKRAASLEAQASQPIINPVEMGWDTAAGGITALIARLQATTYYPDLFTFAFGSSTVTEQRIQQALAQFQRAMISTNSRWDTAYAQVFSATAPGRALNVTLPGFTDQENRGRQLFMTAPNAGGAGCSACHVPPTFALAANSDSNGLDAGETVIFKSPSLKSVGQSRFFMHDGRFTTLDQVVEHYNSGVQAGPALDNRLRGPGGTPQRLNLSAADKAALVAFMQTLTDTQITGDARFADPFKR